MQTNGMKTLTEQAVRAKIRAHIDKHHGGNQAAAARAWGYSRGFVCDVLKGRAAPGDRMLETAGIERRIVYRNAA